MDTLLRSLNYDLQFDKDAQHILQNSHSASSVNHINNIALSSTPTITTFDTTAASAVAANAIAPLQQSITTSDFLQKLGASLINSIQLQSSSVNLQPVVAENMDFSLTPHHVIIDGNNYDTAMTELQKQVDYDKFMNEIWIGIVLTLILISLVFSFCSCFLYHQFRVWKRNFRTSITQNNDDDNIKINLDLEDPVPEYTLVSGLPSYDAALELLHKNPKSCLIVHPSVFEVFNKNEKTVQANLTAVTNNSGSENVSDSQASAEALTPLLNETAPKAGQFVIARLPSYQEAAAAATMTVNAPTSLPYNHSLTSISLINEKSMDKSQSCEKSTKSSSSQKEEKSVKCGNP